MSASPPEAVTLKPVRSRWLVLFVFSVVAAAAAFWIASLGESSSWLAWIAGAWFAFRALVAAPVAFGVGAYLRLDRRGFIYQTPLRTVVHAWRDTSEVSFHKWNHHVLTVSVDGGRRRLVLPDTYGRSPQELCDLMNAYRALAQLDADRAG